MILSRAVSRGMHITSLGCLWHVVSLDAIAFEDHPVHKHIAKFTVGQCKANGGMAQYTEGEVNIGPAGATH